MSAAPRPITVAILAMGGEGGGVLADWLADLAEHAGWHAQATSVPGVAQRTGATVYYLELFPGAHPAGAGRDPVLALMPTAGEVDLAVASELMEAARAVQRGLVTPDRTVLIASTHRVYAMTEKMAMGDGRVDAQRLLQACQAAARACVLADFAALCAPAQAPIGAALFGAIAASGRLPFSLAEFRAAIERGGVGVAASLAAFEAGCQGAASALAGEPQPLSPSPAKPDAPLPGTGPALAALADRIGARLPLAVRATVIHGIRRLAEYQDVAYAAEYLALLERFVGRAPDPAWLDELARHLALWMSYEDVIRVADLKTRPERLDRVAAESGLQPGQVLMVDEFLHPRLDEIADLLPERLGRRVLAGGPLAWLLGRFVGRGRVVRSSSPGGYLSLFVVARLRRWRRGSLRHQRERALIDAWLAAIESLLDTDPALALELIRNQRLVKGYADTHARGLGNYRRLLALLPAVRPRAGAAALMAALREAALADEQGEKLAAAIAGFGLPEGVEASDAVPG
ncbi:MAG: indolepyruvate oxidoreductase subunit beta family protein [Burkholderiales bacterium]